MSFNLFLRPTNDAKVSYEYKTDVLSTYNNSEDRIAQRDIPRITFSYSYAVNDYKKAYDLENRLQNTGNASSIFVPDWFCGIEVENIQQGTNQIVVSQYSNFAKNQYVMLLRDDGSDLVAHITDRDDRNNVCTLVVDSTASVAHAYMYPLFECEVNDETTANRVNPLTNSFELEVMVKTPVFSPISKHNVQFLGHDVFCDDLQITNGGNQSKLYQTVQENDYEIGVKDRFTFFNRMYNSFATTILTEDLEYARNFIKRRWGKTFACFIPSGVADFAKHDYPNELTDVVYVKKSGFDFEARPFIAISHGNQITYAQIVNVGSGDVYQALTIDTETVTTVTLNAHNNVIDVTSGGDLGFFSSEIDSIQSLLFVRLDEDEITFTYAGNSADNKGLYSIELSLIETDFYDSSLVTYETVDGTVVDRDTLFLFKCLDNTIPPTNDVKDGRFVMQRTSSSGVAYDTGKYDNTYCFSGVYIIDTTKQGTSTSSAHQLLPNDFLIDKNQDFCLQFEVRLAGTGELPLLNLIRTDTSVILKYDSAKSSMRVALNPAVLHRSITSVNRQECIEIRQYDGQLSDYHEFAIQRVDGITYVYCDGYLNGSTTSLKGRRLFQGVVIRNTLKVGYFMLGVQNPSSSSSFVADTPLFQQIRLTLNRHVYTGAKMGVMNRVYQLNDYVLPEIKQMDNATIIKNEYRGAGCATDMYKSIRYTPSNRVISGGNVNTLHPYSQFIPAVSCSDNDTYSLGADTSGSSSSDWWIDYINLANLTSSNGVYFPPAHQLKMPFRWHKDLWFDFELEKVGSITNEFILCRLDGIMLKIYVNQDESKWTFGAFGIDPTQENTVWKDCGEGYKTNVALAIDCQHDRVCVFLDGELAYSRSLTAVMRTLEYATLSIYPLAFQQCNAHLHKLRVVDQCLTYDDNYNVNELWTLGYRTTFFDIEYGVKHGDTAPSLNIVDIDNAYELADIYDELVNVERVKRYSIRWSDGSKKAKLLNPAGNTLYTVTVIDNVTGDRGYGWYFVPSNYTGELCRSNFSYSIEYDNDGNEIKTDNIDGIRYNFLLQRYEPYKPNYMSGNITIQKGDKGYYLKSNNLNFFDMFGSDGAVAWKAPYSISWVYYHRWFLDVYVKQIEFVIYGSIQNPANLSYGDYYMRVNCKPCPIAWGEVPVTYIDNTTSRGNFLDYYNSWGWSRSGESGTSFNAYNSPCVISNSYRYVMNKNQGLRYVQIVTVPSSMRDNTNVSWRAFNNSDSYGAVYNEYFTTSEDPLRPIHLVFEFVNYNQPYNSSYYNYAGYWDNILKNFWVNGKKYHVADLLKTIKVMGYSYYSSNVTIPEDPNQFDMVNLTHWIVSSFQTLMSRSQSGSTGGISDFMNNQYRGVGGYFVWNNNADIGISAIKIYDYIKYENDFDCSSMIKNLK